MRARPTISPAVVEALDAFYEWGKKLNPNLEPPKVSRKPKEMTQHNGEIDIDKIHQRTLCRPCNFDEFCEYLFAALYSEFEGFCCTLQLLKRIYELSKNEQGLGVDGIVFAKQEGFVCFEELLASDRLSHVLTRETLLDNEQSGFIEIRYRHAYNKRYTDVPWIRKMKRSKPKCPAAINYYTPIAGDNAGKPKVREIVGDLISYVVDDQKSSGEESSGSSDDEHNEEEYLPGDDDLKYYECPGEGHGGSKKKENDLLKPPKMT